MPLLRRGFPYVLERINKSAFRWYDTVSLMIAEASLFGTIIWKSTYDSIR